MTLADLDAAMQPLLVAFARELSAVIRKHYNERIMAARAAAIENLRSELEAKPEPVAPKKRKRRKPRVKAAPAAVVQRDVKPAKSTGPEIIKRLNRCSLCGKLGHNARGCEGRPDKPPQVARDRFTNGKASAGASDAMQRFRARQAGTEVPA